MLYSPNKREFIWTNGLISYEKEEMSSTYTQVLEGTRPKIHILTPTAICIWAYFTISKSGTYIDYFKDFVYLLNYLRKRGCMGGGEEQRGNERD